MPFKFVDMELDDEDKIGMCVPCVDAPAGKLVPQFPWGLRICLTQHEIEKLDLDPGEVSAGDFIEFSAFAKVTNCSLEDNVNSMTGEKKQTCRIELQIEKLAVEDEDKEGKGEAPKRRRREDFYK